MEHTSRFTPSNFNEVARNKMGVKVGGTILGLARAAQGEFQLTKKEAQKTRAYIYWINKNHPRGFRFRTLYDDGMLLVWRIR